MVLKVIDIRFLLFSDDILKEIVLKLYWVLLILLVKIDSELFIGLRYCDYRMILRFFFKLIVIVDWLCVRLSWKDMELFML